MVTVVVIRSIAGWWHIAPILFFIGFSVAAALVVVLHLPIVIIQTLLVGVLVVTPAHLLAVLTLGYAYKTFRALGGGINVVNLGSTSRKTKS